MAESERIVGRWRMHKRTETKPDGRRIYYYSFQLAQPPDSGMLIATQNAMKEDKDQCACENANCVSDDTDDSSV